MSPGIVTLLEIQLAHDMVHLHEFLLEPMHSAQMVVQTILRLSPSKSLTPQKNSSSTVRHFLSYKFQIYLLALFLKTYSGLHI